MSTNDLDQTLISLNGQANPGPKLPKGSTVDRYVVLEVLGMGGMGVVYKAYDPQLNRGVALKLMQTLEDERDGSSPSAGCLLREARALAQLAHPNVVAVHDAGRVGPHIFLAMELVEGKTLSAWRKDTGPSLQESLEVMRAVGQGLAAAHKAGLVHRDVKPSNVIVGEDGRVRLIDFGLARQDATEPAAAMPGQRSFDERKGPVTAASSQHTTQLVDQSGWRERPGAQDLLSTTPVAQVGGGIAGTPLYMAPEQYSGARVDELSDQFCFCVTFYEVLYGKRPFSGSSPGMVAKEVRAGRVQPAPPDSKIPKWIREILVQGLSIEPQQRYPSMDALLADLDNDPLMARKKALSVLGLALLVAGSIAGMVYGVTRESRQCKGAEANLAGIWDGKIKHTVEGAFNDLDKAYGKDAFAGVVRALDAHTAEWVAMHTEACEATRMRGEQSEELLDLRMLCLKQRLNEIAALTKQFQKPDAQVLQRATQAAHDLTAIAWCADIETLSTRLPPPKDEAARKKVGHVQSQVASAKALARVGKLREAIEEAKTAVVAAEKTDYTPVEAEARAVLADCQDAFGAVKAAEATFYQALQAAAEAKDDRLVAHIMNRLLWNVGYEQGRYDDVPVMIPAVKASVARAGDAVERGELEMQLGTIRATQGKHDEARRHYERAVVLFEKALGPRSSSTARALGNLGLELDLMGHPRRALECNERSLSIFKRTSGVNHSGYAKGLVNSGYTLIVLDQIDEARERIEQGLRIYERTVAPDSPALAWARGSFASVLVEQGHYEQARRLAKASLADGKNTIDGNHPDVASGLATLGEIAREQGHYQAAREYHERALAIVEQAFGRDHPEVAYALDDLALVLHAQGSYQAERILRERSLAKIEKAFDSESPALAPTLTGLGQCLLALKRPKDAESVLRRALAVLENTDRPGPSMLAEPQFALARAVLASNGGRGQALTLAKRARENYAKVRKYKTTESVEVDRWLHLHGD